MKNKKSKIVHLLVVLFLGGLFGSTVSVAQPLHPATPKKTAPKPWQYSGSKASTPSSTSRLSIKPSIDWAPIYDGIFLFAFLGVGYLIVKKVCRSLTIMWIYIAKSLSGGQVLSPADLVRKRILRKYFTEEEALSLIIKKRKARGQHQYKSAPGNTIDRVSKNPFDAIFEEYLITDRVNVKSLMESILLIPTEMNQSMTTLNLLLLQEMNTIAENVEAGEFMRTKNKTQK